MNSQNPQQSAPPSSTPPAREQKRSARVIAIVSAVVAVLVLIAGIIWIVVRGGSEDNAKQPSSENPAATTTVESGGPSHSDGQPSATDTTSEDPSENGASDDSNEPGADDHGGNEQGGDSDRKPDTGVDVQAGKLPKAGAPAPRSAIKAERTRQVRGSLVASIQVPSGNIGCNIYKPESDQDRMGNQLMCTVDSWKTNPPKNFREEASHHTPDDDAMVAITEADRKPFYGSARVEDKCYKKDVCEKGFEGQVLEYGTAVKHGDYVCQSEKAGLTCWNTKTGRTVFMSKEDLRVF